MNISFVIPVFKEEDNILELINKIDDNCSEAKIKYKIFLVDDSPTDIIEVKIQKLDINIHYIFRGKKLGRGTAVLEGISKAINTIYTDIIIEMDGDLSHDPVELKHKIKKFKEQKLDMLIASRYDKNSKILNWPISRKILSYISNTLAKIFLKIPVTDYTNGYRFYSKESAIHITNNCGKIGDGFIVLSEILMELYYNDFKIGEDSTIFKNRKRGESNVNIKLILSSILGLLKLFFIKLRKYKK